MKNSLLNNGYAQMLLLVWPFILPAGCLQAQITIQFMPGLNSQSVNGLFTAQVQNSAPVMYNGRLKITVRDGNNRIVLLATTPSMAVRPGANLIQPLAAQVTIQFGNSPSAAVVAQTGRFPEDEYEYCFEFTGTESKPAAGERIFENCYNYHLQPVLPLSLVYPGDGDALCNTRPGFSWQPAMPLVSSYRYRILITEKKDSQDPASALATNMPVFQQDNLTGYMLPYPAMVPDLHKNNKYVWQVMAYEGNTRITQSEIWVFTIDCNDKKTDSSIESYRQLSAALNGNYYVASGTLHFSLLNPYNGTNMQYSLIEISNPAKDIRNLPAVKVQTGLNKVDVTLDDVHGMQTGKMYLLKVKNIGDHALYLQFLFKGKDTL